MYIISVYNCVLVCICKILMSQPWINRVIIIITLLLLSIYMPTFLKYNNHVRKLVKLSEANESNQELLLK